MYNKCMYRNVCKHVFAFWPNKVFEYSYCLQLLITQTRQSLFNNVSHFEQPLQTVTLFLISVTKRIFNDLFFRCKFKSCQASVYMMKNTIYKIFTVIENRQYEDCLKFQNLALKKCCMLGLLVNDLLGLPNIVCRYFELKDHFYLQNIFRLISRHK